MLSVDTLSSEQDSAFVELNRMNPNQYFNSKYLKTRYTWLLLAIDCNSSNKLSVSLNEQSSRENGICFKCLGSHYWAVLKTVGL